MARHGFMAASSTGPADAAVGTQRKGEGTEDTAYWVQILPSHSFMATTSQTKPQYVGPFVGTNRKSDEVEDTDYYGMADKLDDPIPCVHSTKRALSAGRTCVKCGQGPLWEGRFVCCGRCGIDGHSALCSLNFLPGTHGYEASPSQNVTVPLSFLRRLAWSTGNPDKA